MNQQNETYITSTLAEIRRLSSFLEAEETAYNARIETVREEYANRTAESRKALETAQKDLMSRLKKQKKDIFPGDIDRVGVTGGILLRHVAPVVRKARHITVDFLRNLNLRDAIHVEESVDWKEIGTWSDKQLCLLGTERSKKESFAYELTEANHE